MNNLVLKNMIENILIDVEKPGRYIGGEVNSITKNEYEVNVLFAFPDLYEIGMSFLGLEILYHLVNNESEFAMERTFMPYFDMFKKLEEMKIPLFSLESFKEAKDFNFLAFTLQYEMSFINILKMIELSGIPKFAIDRIEGEYPLVIGGGPCSVNPESICSFFDLILIGDGEEAIIEIMELAKKYIKDKKWIDKKGFLLMASNIKGIYIPSFYEDKYSHDKYVGTFLKEEYRKIVPEKISRRIVSDLNKIDFCEKQIVPFVDAVHDRSMLEVLRGCTHGCRFCQAGIIYRPVRERSLDNLKKSAINLIKNSGHDDISLTSLSTADYTKVEELVDYLVDEFKDDNVSISLPSLRVDTFSVKLAQKIQTLRKTGFTFAPEAGSQRMRDVINKGVTEENLEEVVTSAFRAGWKRIKLYYMIGLPTETDEDILDILRLSERVLKIGHKVSKRNDIKVTVSVSSFVPKAFTPFEFFPQNTEKELIRKQKILINAHKSRGIKLSYHNSRITIYEGLIARGGRKLAPFLEYISLNGKGLDGWDEHIDFDLWEEALKKFNIDVNEYNYRAYDNIEPLYWDHIDVGVDKDFLYKEYQEAYKSNLTKDCRLGCNSCGLCDTDIKNRLEGEYFG